MNVQPDIVLIHGLFLSARSWQPWSERYSTRGFRVHTPEWPGLGDGDVAALRADPSPLARLDIATILTELEQFVRSIPTPPIIMGHSFGGLFAQLLAYRGLGRATVGIDSTAPAGVLSLPFSTLRASAPVLANPFNIGKATMLDARAIPLCVHQYAFCARVARAVRALRNSVRRPCLVRGSV